MRGRTGTAEPGHADPSCGLEPRPGTRPVPPAMARTDRRTSWPLLAHLGPLGALPTAPRVARCLTRVILTTWGIDGLADTAELIVSELTTNSSRLTSPRTASCAPHASGC